MQKSDFIYKLKGIAIICVICAHCGNRVSHSQIDLFLDGIRNSIAV